MLDLLRIADANGIEQVSYTNAGGASGTMPIARLRRELLDQQDKED
jgi:hypothetical protein